MNNAVRLALLLPGVLVAAPLVPAVFGVADPDGIWSLQTNPAGLARMREAELGLESGGRQSQSQDALAAGSAGWAAGWDHLPSESGGTWDSNLRFGYGHGFAGGLSAGVSAIRHDVDGSPTGWSADLGFLWQPSRYLSLGWLVPNLLDRDDSRSTGNAVGLAIRPTASSDLQVGMEARLARTPWVRSSWNDPTWEATARIQPASWLALDARVDPAHPGRWGLGVSAQATPELRFFSRTAPAPKGTEFQTFGAHWTRLTRQALGVTSPVMVYRLPQSLSESGTRTLWGTQGGLRKVRTDFQQMEHLNGLTTVVLDLGSPRLSPSTSGALRRLVLDLRSHGIKVYAWAHDLDMGTLHVLSAADRAGIDPDGAVRTKGLSMEQLYLGRALRNHGVEVQVSKTGPWKSAMEPFESDHMSQPARDNLQRLLQDIDSSIMAGVVTGRGVDPVRLVAYVDTGSLLPRTAVAQHLVDTLVPESDLAKWARAPQRGPLEMPLEGSRKESWGQGRKIAVVLLEGQIVDRDGETGMVPWATGLSAERAAAEIDRLRRDPSVGAVVLRVNSPGGSVSGSQRLRRAVEELAAKKPVAASFGATSASGAYMLSLPAARIFAEPEGVVGSIGAFAAKVSVRGLLDSLGIRAEQVRTAPHAGALSPFSPLDSLESARLSDFVEDAHREFSGLVRRWRKLDSAAFDRVDGGRVFSGTRAVDLGLADSAGGLDDAIRWARHRANLPSDAAVRWVEPQPSRWSTALDRADALTSMRGPSLSDRIQSGLNDSRIGVWAQAAWDPRWE